MVEANTLLSGLGFESAGLAAAHSLHNGLTALPATRACYHGEKVAFGVLVSLFLTDKPPALMDQVYDFCDAIGLPTTLADLGLPQVSDGELLAVAEKACARRGEHVQRALGDNPGALGGLHQGGRRLGPRQEIGRQGGQMR